MHEEENGLELTAEILREFLQESEEHLSKAESALLSMETKEADKDGLNRAFRAFHTIKGTADYLSFRPLKDLAHFCEEILDRARSGGRAPEKNVLTWLIRAVDGIKASLKKLEAAGSDYKEMFDRSCRELMESVSAGIISGMAMAPAAEGSVLDLTGAGQAESRQAIKIDAQKFNSLMDSLNELAVAETIIRNEVNSNGSAVPEDLKAKINSMGKITARLSYDSSALKMLPFQHLFNKMTRLVRDLSVKSGKKIKLILNGGETEIDREIIENLSEPIMHIIRNAVDHGIEGPEEREKSGKSAAGMVTLSAHCRDGEIVIAVSDDGRGLNKEKIIAKALKAGLIGPGESPDNEKICELILTPGFTTADKVTELSGRGVGMDAVKKAVENYKGRMKMKYIAGHGTKITMIFPVNMAVIEGLTVSCCGETYIIPVSNIESVTMENGAAEGPNLINEYICGSGIKGDDCCAGAAGGTRPARGGERIMINMERKGGRKSLLADRIVSQNKIAVRNIPGMMLEKTMFSGAAVMPDGRPALIISPERIIESEV